MMKKTIFAAVLAAFAAMVSCSRPGIPEMPATYIETDVSDIGVPAEASTFALQVLSDGYWEVVTPEWISAKPAFGYGDNRLVLSIARNGAEGEACFAPLRTDRVVLRGRDLEKVIPLLQGGQVTADDFLSKNDDPHVYWQVNGTIRSIEDAEFGRITVSDGTADIPVFNVLDEDGRNKRFDTMNLYPGDVVTLYGYKESYEGRSYLFNARVLEIDYNGFYLSHNKVTPSFNESSLDVAIYDGENVQISCDADWVHIGSVRSADGHQAVTLTVDANPVYDKRNATVVFSKGEVVRSVYITQDAHPVYRFLLENRAEAVGKKAGSTSITLHANSALRWKVEADEGIVLDRKEGLGSATVSLTYPDNPEVGTHQYTVRFTTENEFAEQKELVFTLTQDPRLYAEWLFDTDHCPDFQYAFGVKTLGTYTRDLNAGDGGLYAPSNRGEGRISYVQIDKHNLSGADGVSGRSVDKNGKLIIQGGYKGDYWLLEAGDGTTPIPAGTPIRVRFWTATSAGGFSLTRCEYSETEGQSWQVPETWNTEPEKHLLRPVHKASPKDFIQGNFPNLNSADEGVLVNCVQEGVQALLPIDFTVTTTREIKVFQVRLVTAAALNTNHDDMTGKTNSGTFRITGDFCTIEVAE